jgi:hypothetical protein
MCVCCVIAVTTPPANDPTPAHLSEMDRAAEVAISRDAYPDRWAVGAAGRPRSWLAFSKLILHPLCKREDDRLVGAAKQRKRHSEAEHVGGSEIDYHLSVRSLLLLSRSFDS